MASSRKKSFTLVELLVVVAVITILAAMMAPMLVKAQEAANRFACANNVSSVWFGLKAYTEDYRGFFPSWSYESAPNPRFWYSFVEYYVTGDPFPLSTNYCRADFWRCPTNPVAKRTAFGFPDLPYGYNVHLGYFARDGSVGPATQKVRVSEIRRPSQIIATGDGDGDGSYDAYLQDTWAIPGNLHDGGSNLAYVDGHVRWIPQLLVIRNPTQTEELRMMWGMFGYYKK